MVHVTKLAHVGLSAIDLSTQAEFYMDRSMSFATRINELAGDIEVFEAAREAYDRKASRPGFTTGVAA